MRSCHLCPAFVPPRARRCPACGAAARPRARWLTALTGASLSTVLAACYGAAYPRHADTLDPRDYDGDSWTTAQDCSDEDPAVHPGAEELAGDGVDSDCDALDDPPPQ